MNKHVNPDLVIEGVEFAETRIGTLWTLGIRRVELAAFSGLSELTSVELAELIARMSEQLAPLIGSVVCPWRYVATAMWETHETSTLQVLAQPN